MSVIRPVVLSGGSGTRLWPISQERLPKQFLPLIGEKTLFALTMERAVKVASGALPTVVTGNIHASIVEGQLEHPAQVLVEPGPRNTAAAICAAALVAATDDVLVVMPSDHLIADFGAFDNALSAAVQIARTGGVVTFGIVPDRADEGYGWIKRGAAIGSGHQILEFVEKPPREVAISFLAGGNYYWNSGMFVVTAGVVLKHLGRHSPEVLAAVERSLPETIGDRVELGEPFLSSPSISFDHAVMEKLNDAFVVPLDAGWSDIGSWDAIWEAMDKDTEGNFLTGDVVSLDSANSLVHSTNLPIALIGLEGVVVIETEHGVLVADRESAQRVKSVVEQLRLSNGESD